MNPSVERFLNSLTPEDIGCVVIGNSILRFEGFTDECWRDAIEKGKSCDGLRDEIVRNWDESEGAKGKTLTEDGWWTENIFYAIYSVR